MKEPKLKPRQAKRLTNVLNDIEIENLEQNLNEIIEDDEVEFDENGEPKEILFDWKFVLNKLKIHLNS